MTVRSVIVNCPARTWTRHTLHERSIAHYPQARPLACFAGIWTNWTSVRKVKESATANDLSASLTTEPNVEVGAIHPKAMPVILVTSEEVETWMTAAPDQALKLQS